MDLQNMDIRTILDIVAISSVGLFGFFALLGNLNKAQKANEKQADEAGDRVINLLKEQVSALETKVEEQARLLTETSSKLDLLVNENKILRDILQGRDKDFVNYQKQGLEAMKRGEEIYKMVKEIKETVGRLVTTPTTNVTVQK